MPPPMLRSHFLNLTWISSCTGPSWWLCPPWNTCEEASRTPYTPGFSLFLRLFLLSFFMTSISLNECILLSRGISWWLGQLRPPAGEGGLPKQGSRKGWRLCIWKLKLGRGREEGFSFQRSPETSPKSDTTRIYWCNRWEQALQQNCGMPHKREEGCGLRTVWVPAERFWERSQGNGQFWIGCYFWGRIRRQD